MSTENFTPEERAAFQHLLGRMKDVADAATLAEAATRAPVGLKLAAIALDLGSAIWGAFVLASFWAWFAVPLGAPPTSTPLAFCFLLGYQAVTWRADWYLASKPARERWLAQLAATIATVFVRSVLLTAGAALHFWGGV